MKDDIVGFLGMDLGYIEEDYAQQQQAVMILARSRDYADTPPMPQWELIEIATAPRQTILDGCRAIIKSGAPVICWGTDQSFYGTTYLIAVYVQSPETGRAIREVVSRFKVHEVYVGKVRVIEAARNGFKWALQFAANIFG